MLLSKEAIIRYFSDLT